MAPRPRPRAPPPAPKQVPNTYIYQFKMTIKKSKPIIWRRVHIPDDYTFEDLNNALVAVMQWNATEEFEFRSNREEIAKKTTISSVFKKIGSTVSYTYNPALNWFVQVAFEGIQVADPDVASYPVCIGGHLASPPSNVNGLEEYYDLVKTLSDRKNPKYDEVAEWVEEEDIMDRFDQSFIFNPDSILFD